MSNWLPSFGLGVLFGRLLNVRPRVSKVNGTLVASTAPHIALLTLGLKLRTVIIDPKQRAVRIFARYCWLIPIVRRIPFDAVQKLIYAYSDYAPESGIGVFAYQEQDMFVVKLLLVNNEEVLLCRFFGQGDFVNESIFPDWMHWEGFLDARLSKGSQTEASLAYAEMVSALIGVPLEND